MSLKLLELETSNLVHGFVWQCRAGTQINFPESGRGLGHVTPTIFGSTVGYPSDSLDSCFMSLIAISKTRSEAVARIAYRTASQHPRESRDVISHVTICHFLLVVLWNGVYIFAVFEILRFKRIAVTSLTFQGHVTSSVT